MGPCRCAVVLTPLVESNGFGLYNFLHDEVKLRAAPAVAAAAAAEVWRVLFAR